jgi:N,N-dimethylformamidase beta subunit-like, C-terminal/Concanavalin A-like lectin/glucanases superfamily/Bacterial Ig-like domain/Bacterial Ig domain/Calx-beta domain
VFLSVGHDEYWSAAQRANVEAARDAGVNLAFFSGNECFWKVRWENSIDSSGTSYRTLVCYKESKDGAKIDPSSTWTGTWRDNRFSPPSDGGKPENALSGTLYMNDRTSTDLGVPLKVSAEDGKLRFWRNTSVASMSAGQTATLGQYIVGYETDEDLDNGFRPAGLITMSTTPFSTSSHVVVPWGTEVGPGSSTHKITLYRAASGALVFGSGTIQWPWGLDGNHNNTPTTPDVNMQQATVNLFADMGAQPGSLQTGLAAATRSTDATAPTSTITSPASGAVLQVGTPVTITGTATESGGGRLAAVEVSIDNGVTWHRATGLASWSYTWTPSVSGPTVIKSRAVDDSCNLETPSAGRSVTVSSTNTLVLALGFNETGGTTAADASNKANNGTLSGATWTTAGKYGGALTFDGVNDLVTVADSSSLDLSGAMTLEAWVRPTAINGWESVILKEANADLAYALYADNNGNDTGGPRRPVVSVHQGTNNTFWTPGSSQLATNTWTHLAATYDGTALKMYVNGTLATSLPLSGSIDVTSGALRIGGNNIWGEWFSGQIDEVRVYSRALAPSEIQTDMNTPIGGADTTAPTVSSVAPANGATGVLTDTNVTATFSESVNPTTVTTSTFELRDSANALVPATVSYNSSTSTATLDPSSTLAWGATYTARVKGGSSGVKDSAGNALAADFTWSFTTAASPPPPTISINNVSVTEGNSGTVNATFTVTLSAASSQTVTVTYATADGTATAGSDYTAVPPTTLTFTPGQTSKTVAVSVLGDTAFEANETFFVNLSNPTNATFADSQGLGTITDDDNGLIGSDGFGYSAFTFPYETLDLLPAGAGVFIIRNVGDNNTSTVNLPTGKTFSYYGTSYTSLIVSTNGLITFGTGTNSATNTDLTSSPTQRAIAPLWDDWNDILGSAMVLGRYDDTDANGTSDRLIIEWNVQGSPTSPSPVTFQAILHLSTAASPGSFTFNYPDTDSGDSRTDGASSTVGIKDSGTQGANRLLVQFDATSPYVGSAKAIRFTVTPDATPPAVSVTSPAAGATVSGTVTVTADASDNIGVAGVQFMLDGASLGAEDTTAPYSVSWNTTAVTNGTHTLTARARDAAGNVTTSSAISVTVSNTASSGPVAAFGFNETSGTTASDNSGTGNAGTVSGAAWTAGGKFGGALSFDGVNDWVTVADSNSLDLTTAMTVEAWVRPATINGWETVLMKESAASYGYGLYADNNGNDVGQPRRPAAWMVQSGSYFGAEGTSQLPVNTWTHLAATYDGSTLRLYVNGTQAGSVNRSGSIDVTSGALRIGGNAIWGEFFAGLIDEVRVYGRALSATEIQSDMNTPVGSPEHLMGEEIAAAGAVPLSQEELRPLFDEAVRRWSAALGDAQAVQTLRAVRVEVMDLPGPTLGLASGAVIYLDANAAGHGWFLDPTPWEDSEFAAGLTSSPAAARVDLLTVLAHEMGHILGLDDDSATDPSTGTVMAEVLPLGVRRIHLGGLLSEPKTGPIPPGLQPLSSPEPAAREARMLISVPPTEVFPANDASVPSRLDDRESMTVWSEIDPPSDVFLRVGFDRRPPTPIEVRANLVIPDSVSAWDDRFWTVRLPGLDS